MEIITNELIDFKKYLKYSEIFIETGSFQGRTIEKVLNIGYKTILSVEAAKNWYEKCCEKFALYDNVFLYYGESIKELPIMLNHDNVKNNICVIFLDAHPSGDTTFGYKDLEEKGINSEYYLYNIIKKELEIVLDNNKNHIIIIDDLNKDSKDTKLYIEMILKINPNYNFYWYNEILEHNQAFYENKILVCLAYNL